MTWDYHVAVDWECTNNECIEPQYGDIANTCNIATCQAECETDGDCYDECHPFVPDLLLTIGACSLETDNPACQCSWGDSIDCNSLDCSTGIYLDLNGDQAACMGDDYICKTLANDDDCVTESDTACIGPDTCDANSECTEFTCLAEVGTCHYTAGAYVWHTGDLTDVEALGESSCVDGYDNDCDGLTDCEDDDCHGQTGPQGGICCDDHDDCNFLDDDYCDPAELDMHDEGVCNQILECEVDTTQEEDCDASDLLYCNGLDISFDDYKCHLGTCVFDQTSHAGNCDDTYPCTDDACHDNAGNPFCTNNPNHDNCNGNDEVEVAECTYSPDDDPYTWDYRAAFDSACVDTGGGVYDCTVVGPVSHDQGTDPEPDGVDTECGDNCPNTANADQANNDADSHGDACDK